jgi:hypothetical protein
MTAALCPSGGEGIVREDAPTFNFDDGFDAHILDCTSWSRLQFPTVNVMVHGIMPFGIYGGALTYGSRGGELNVGLTTQSYSAGDIGERHKGVRVRGRQDSCGRGRHSRRLYDVCQVRRGRCVHGLVQYPLAACTARSIDQAYKKGKSYQLTTKRGTNGVDKERNAQPLTCQDYKVAKYSVTIMNWLPQVCLAWGYWVTLQYDVETKWACYCTDPTKVPVGGSTNDRHTCVAIADCVKYERADTPDAAAMKSTV